MLKDTFVVAHDGSKDKAEHIVGVFAYRRATYVITLEGMGRCSLSIHDRRISAELVAR
jgi:hypothetical protein